MRGIGVDRSQLLVAVPKTDHFQPRIDQALGQVANRGIAHGAVAGERGFAAGVDHPSV